MFVPLESTHPVNTDVLEISEKNLVKKTMFCRCQRARTSEKINVLEVSECKNLVKIDMLEVLECQNLVKNRCVVGLRVPEPRKESMFWRSRSANTS